MPTIDIPIKQVMRSGVADEAAVAATNDMAIPDNDGLVVLEVANPTGGTLTVSFAPAATFGGFGLESLDVDIPSSATRWIGPFPPAVFNQTDGTVAVSAETGLTLRGLRI